jgi:outer membrane autotransporter protein
MYSLFCVSVGVDVFRRCLKREVVSTNISMCTTPNARWVPILLRRAFIRQPLNSLQPRRKAAPSSADKASGHKWYAVYPFTLIFFVVLASSMSSLVAQTVSDLGAAQSFAVLGGSTVTNTGLTLITGNLGVSPGSAITGFPPGVISQGALHAADPLAVQAEAATATAYATLVGEASPPANNLTGQDLGGLTLAPGVYHFNTSVGLDGALLLDTTADPTGTFVFQIGTTLITSSASTVSFVGPADPNVFWQVGSSATLGTGTQFDGNILAMTSITLTTGASINVGRALAINGAVTLDTNSVNAFEPLPARFWNGGASQLWSGVNWSPDATGATTSTLAPDADVVFSVTGIPPQHQNTILDVDEAISSLTVNDPAAVTISGPNTLSITGTGVSTGITINTGAGLVTINSNLLLSGLPETITVNNAAGLVITGIVGGTIGLQKAGTGVLTLTGAETYTGGTLISAGTLQLGDGIAAGTSIASSGTVTIGNATLAVNLKSGETFGNTTIDNGLIATVATGTNTLSGAINGSGALVQVGTGLTVLTGADTYTGSTTVLHGTLQIGNGLTGSISGVSPVTITTGAQPALVLGTFIPALSNGATLAIDLADGGIFSNNVTNNGLLTTIASGTNTLSGVISGSGAFTQNGAGTTILTGANTYTGATTVLQGILQIGNAGTSGSVPGNVTDNTSLVFDRSDNLTYAGTVTGPGSVTQSGSGKLILSAANTYTGGTNFNGGVLAVASDGILGTGPLTFNGGTLEALSGIVSAKPVTLHNAGGTFLAEDSSSSTLSGVIGGPGSLTKAGTGELVLAGLNTYSGGTNLNAGTLTVNSARALGAGNVTVNAGILRTQAQPINVTGNYVQTGGTLQLNVAGGSPGQYDTVNVGGNAKLGGTLQLLSGGFVPKPGNLLTLIITGGAVSGQFAQFIDPFAHSPGITTVDLLYNDQSVQVVFVGMTPVPGAGPGSVPGAGPASPVNSIFEANTVEALTAFYEISFSNANIQRLTLEDRLDDIRNGSSGFSSNIKVNGAQTEHDGKTSLDGKSAPSVVEPVLQSSPQNRWGVWLTGFGDFVSVDSEENAHGYDFTTGGVSLGIDFRVTDFLAIGAMGEYSHTWTTLDPSGHIDVDSGRGGLYATLFSNGFYLNSGIYGGHNNYDSGRSSFLGIANGSTEGEEWSTFVSGGYDFHFGHLTIGPIAALQYTDVHVDGFTEKGSTAPLDVHSGSEESLRSDVGFRVFYGWQIGNIVIQPSLKAAWEHEYKYSALPITAGFAGIPGPSATFFGPSEGHDSAVVSAGVSVRFTPTISTYLYYDGQLGRGNYESNAVTGGVRISF